MLDVGVTDIVVATWLAVRLVGPNLLAACRALRRLPASFRPAPAIWSAGLNLWDGSMGLSDPAGLRRLWSALQPPPLDTAQAAVPSEFHSLAARVPPRCPARAQSVADSADNSRSIFVAATSRSSACPPVCASQRNARASVFARHRCSPASRCCSLIAQPASVLSGAEAVAEPEQ